MSKVMGSDTTTDALKWQFRRFKAGARNQLSFLEAGDDPKDAPCDCNPDGKPVTPRNFRDNRTTSFPFVIALQ